MATVRVSDEQMDTLPPAGKAVLALIRVDGQLRRVRAMWIPRAWLEAQPWDDDTTGPFEEVGGDWYYRQGWYEATAVEPTLTPIDELIAWMGLPVFSAQESAE